MEITSKYNPSEVEEKWYEYWLEHKFFHSEPDGREPYTVVIPPPNVTGVLHMGHMLNNTIQDVLVRRARMQGKNACWVPGTDHASIATEAKVVAKLAAEGVEKSDLTREQFLEHAWEWTRKHGGIILEQLKKLGASCDWDRTAFTMDEPRSESVIKVFCDLFEKGLIYRGVRMVNWDPQALTALSDEEVIHRETQGKLYYLNYKVEGSDKDYIVVATTRPETILGDVAVCVNPNDERFAAFKGKRVIVPLVGRSVPIIEDDYVDMEFGTGALKITPAHDVNDFAIGEKFGLETIDIFNDNGTINDKVGMYTGEDRFAVREKIVKDLQEANLMHMPPEHYTNKVGYSERTGAVIEPKLSMQWFLKMEDLAKPALAAVEDDTVKFYPEKFKNTYHHWMTNIKDWCISRQLWWGHQIPAYYLPEGGFVVAETPQKALQLAHEKTGNKNLQLSDLRQDEDCLDTWFSSWLWPISVFNGINQPDNADIKYYYPTNDLVTAPEIIFFWVARMIISGYKYRSKECFKNVYFTGIVRDKLGRKMSKSLGNSPDPIELMNKYGADGVRVGMLLASPAGNDLFFDESLCQQGAGFATKIWNAFRLVKSWEVSPDIMQPEHSRLAVEWFRNKLAETVEILDQQFQQFRISEALMTVYTSVRDEFSGWLLETIKPAYQQPIDLKTYSETVELFDQMLRLMHPFMPFITEEIWQMLSEREMHESIMILRVPEPGKYDAELLAAFENVKEAISGIRKIRTDRNIPQKETLNLEIQKGDKGFEAQFNSVVMKMGNLSALDMVADEVQGAASFRVKSTVFYIRLEGFIDVYEELKKLEEELNYTKGFLVSVLKKLDNAKFTGSAPAAVVEKERAKQADAEAKIKVLEERIVSLK